MPTPMTIVLVLSWGFNYSEARYYGWRHSVHVGRFIMFWGYMTPAELVAYDEQRMGRS